MRETLPAIEDSVSSSYNSTYLLLCFMFYSPLHWELLQRARAVDNQVSLVDTQHAVPPADRNSTVCCLSKVFFAACSPARSQNKDDYQVWDTVTYFDTLWASQWLKCLFSGLGSLNNCGSSRQNCCNMRAWPHHHCRGHWLESIVRICLLLTSFVFLNFV